MLRGFADLHNHQFANLAFGGRVVHGQAWGELEEALPRCDRVHGPAGLADLAGNLMQHRSGGSLLGHGVEGFPGFGGWPRWSSFTHQAVHEEWLHRAVEGGLRLVVMLAVNNELLCRFSRRRFGCNDMDAVDRQLTAARVLEDLVDKRHGGAGKGWYRIVTTPAEARAVIESGRLAVVLGIEVDYLFDCRDEADLSQAQLRRELDRYHDLGVRYLVPIHFSDNGFGGAALQNPLQRATRQPAWSLDNLLPSKLNPLGPLGAYVLETEDASSFGYRYRTGRRNLQGLTRLGKALVHETVERGMLVDVDHMSARSRADVLRICEQTGYPVLAGHTAFVHISKGDRRMEKHLLPDEVRRIQGLGGMVGVNLDQGGLEDTTAWSGPNQPAIPHSCGGTSNTVVQAYLYAAAMMQGGPVGLGSDLNGFAAMPGPRHGPDRCPGGRGDPQLPSLDYPFRAAASDETMARSVAGSRTFDLNLDGVAHVGMLPDLIADFEAMGLSRADLEPLLSSADGFVSLWERASGRPAAALPPWRAVVPPVAR